PQGPGGELSASGLLCFYDLIDGAQLEGDHVDRQADCQGDLVHWQADGGCWSERPLYGSLEVGDLGGHRQQDCYGDRGPENQETHQRLAQSAAPPRQRAEGQQNDENRSELAQCSAPGDSR